MTNKTKNHLSYQQSIELRSKAKKQWVYSLQKAVIALNCAEPEPIFFNGHYLYV
jgi:hypothetical protein